MIARGWCPSVHEPMATGDGLLVRIKPRGGVLTATETRLIAHAAEIHGNGVLELTNRGNLQIRGLSPDAVRTVAATMVAAGLAHPDPAAERRRNVIATPLADIDPAVAPATAALTAALETALEDASTLTLPPKFTLLVDGGGLLPPTTRADIHLHVFSDFAEITSNAGSPKVALDQAVATTLALLPPPPGEGRGEGGPARKTLIQPSPGGRGLFAVGAVGEIAFGAGLPFGSAAARIWTALADLAERDGDGKLRLTPWRAVLIAGLSKPGALADLGLITEPDDPRLRVSACPGQPACASASVTTRDIAARLRPAAGTSIHVSGCDKGCAHPGPATLTFVGRNGLFDLVRAGRASDVPAQRGLSPAALQ